jgi:hypothetical protein
MTFQGFGIVAFISDHPAPSTMMPRPRRPPPSFPNPKTAHRKEFYSRNAGRGGGGSASFSSRGGAEVTISREAGGERVGHRHQER